MYRRMMTGIIAVALLLLQACSGSDSGSSPYPLTGAGVGAVSVSITDAPAYGFDHVWITVKDLWLHTDGEAGQEQRGWYKFPLSSPITLDLLDLSNGTISAPVWDGIELPEGTYRQVRVHLAATEDALAASAADAGLTFNNQVDVTDPAGSYPLRAPDPRRGILLEGTFEVKKNEKLKIAVDFDAGHDVVKIEHDGKTEYILKPRLVHFDLNNAGAIIGHIDATAAAKCATAQFVVKAEQLGPNGAVHVVRRATFIADPATGLFVLYPLLPGSYDVLIRGIGYETVIIKNVPVLRGTRPQSGATAIPVITMTASPSADYLAGASITSPTGAWVDYYQTISGEDAPYQVRFRHFNPLTGQFAAFPLSTGPLQVGTYDPASITLAETVPVEGNGGFKAEAGAILHERSGFVSVTQAAPTAAFGTLNVRFPATARSVSGMITAPETLAPGTGLDRG
ncbi:MAG TPA: DUF4382 domain-containing protein, partial [Nitrospirota bacterium]|nr:DUF4382 domain-containing protein [Nitrospirota bacterium]